MPVRETFFSKDGLREAFPELADFQPIAENQKGGVFSVRSLPRGHRVALKLTADHGDPAVATRFLREFEFLFQNQFHEHLVRVYGDRGQRPLRMSNGNVTNHFYFTMKLYHADVGKALAERSLALPVRAGIVLQMLDGLSFLHALNVAHRDIKPHNLFLDRSAAGDIVVKLGDFDIAKRRGTEGAGETLTIIGTPYYLAPERWSPQDGEPDWRPSDQYAAGVTAFQILSQGQYPLDLRAISDQLGDVWAYQQIHQSGATMPLRIPERPGERFPKLEQVLYRMLEVKPEGRFADLMQCKRALAAALSGLIA